MIFHCEDQMSLPHPDYDPGKSNFSGGEHTPITPLQGGGQEGGQASIASILGATVPVVSAMFSNRPAQAPAQAPAQVAPLVPATSVPSQITTDLSIKPLENLTPAEQAGVATAGAIASGTIMKATGNLQLAEAAGTSAALAQANTLQSKKSLSSVNISNTDSQMLYSARPEEQELAVANGNKAYLEAKRIGSSDTVANQKKVEASIQTIKDYRVQHPYEDNTVTVDIGELEAKEILATTDPKEREIGEAAYTSARAKAVKDKLEEEDANDAGILAKVQAIKDYREQKVSVPATSVSSLTYEQALKIVASAKKNPYEKILLIYQNSLTNKEARGKIYSPEQLKQLKVIRGAEYIQIYRNKRAPLIKKGTVSTVANNDPHYLEYTQIKKNISSPFRALLERYRANALTGASFETTMKLKIANYEARQKNLWSKGQPPTLPQRKSKNAFNSGQVLTFYSRLTYVLPITTADLIIIPPINGSIQAFIEVLETLGDLGVFNTELKIKENVVIVFTVAFYSSDKAPISIANNTILLSFILDIIEKNPGQLFVLADNTSDGYFVGSTLITRSSNDILINLLEPSNILYPYKRPGIPGIVVSNFGSGVSLPSDASKKQSLQTIYNNINKSKGTRVEHLVYKPDLNKEGAPGYFTIRGSVNPMLIPSERIGGCGLANYSLGDMIEQLHPTRQIHLSPGTIIGFRLKVAGVYEPLCVANKVSKINNESKFVAAVNAQTLPNVVQTGIFEIAGNIFNIRKTNKHDIVYNDWLQGLYSADEASLLNLLNLKPGIMDKIFPLVFNDTGVPIGMPWKNWVADFLAVVTIRNKSLKTHRETMIARNFLEQLRAYFLQKQLKKDLEESDSDDEEAIKRQHGLVEPSDEGVDPLKGETEFKDIKREWGTLDIYENSETHEWICSIILVNKNTERQLYKTIGVSMQDVSFDNAKVALQKKIQELKKKYPDWIFIY